MSDTRIEHNASHTSPDHISHLKDFQVVEFRRYTIKDGKREQFARYFESYFPEAFEQIGAIVFGHFFERENQGGFTWIRGYHDLDARATVNEAFYSGPLWREHVATLNDLMIDSDNVLLLQPLSPEREIMVLPAVDPISEEEGAQGIVVAHIFPVQADGVDAFSQKAEETFASYRTAGVREVGVLATLDVPNNFPRHPIRTDGPYLVWLGVLRDNQFLEKRFHPLAERSSQTLSATGLLRGISELVVLDPASRSRLRWLPER